MLKASFMDKVKSALGWVWDHRSEIGSMISSVASFAAPMLLSSVPTQPIVVSQNYLRQIERVLTNFAGFNDPTLTPALMELAIELERRRTIIQSPAWVKKRLIPVSVFVPESADTDIPHNKQKELTIVTQPQSASV